MFEERKSFFALTKEVEVVKKKLLFLIGNLFSIFILSKRSQKNVFDEFHGKEKESLFRL